MHNFVENNFDAFSQIIQEVKMNKNRILGAIPLIGVVIVLLLQLGVACFA